MAVLVVDDSEQMRAVLADYLSEAGIQEIDEAADGLAAVRLVTANPYQCVFLDLYLPKMNGIEALRAIRAAGNRVPVIIVTTESRQETVRLALAAGANDYLVKPFAKEAFLRKARAAVEVRP